MLAGAPGTAACAAAFSVLAAEGGATGLFLGVGCYAVLSALWLAWEVVAAYNLLRRKLPIVPWRPNLMFNVYAKSRRNLLDRVSGRMAKMEAAGGPHRAFGAVVGNCPFAHIGGASLARAALHAQPVKAPLYHAFKAFAGEGIFTAEGKDWSDKRGEVLQAFAHVGLEPLAAASARVARRLTRDIERESRGRGRGGGARVSNGGGGDETELLQRQQEEEVEVEEEEERDGEDIVLEMLPRLQRATLRATFEYLTGVSVEHAVASSQRSSSKSSPHVSRHQHQHQHPRDAPAQPNDDDDGGDDDDDDDDDEASAAVVAAAAAAAAWEDEYLKAATALRHLIPARARSVWMASDWLYGLSPVGRLEARSIRAARKLPLQALRAAQPGSPLALLAQGAAHGGGGDGRRGVGCRGGIARGIWEMLREGRWSVGGGGEDVGGRGSGGGGEGKRVSFCSGAAPSKALLDEAVTLLFAGHDTQSATLSWALLRLAGDPIAQDELRASLLADPAAAASLGLDDLLASAPASAPAPDNTADDTSETTRATRDGVGVRTRHHHHHQQQQQPAWRSSAGAPTLEAVLRETLRLHPVAPLVVRRLTSDAIDAGGTPRHTAGTAGSTGAAGVVQSGGRVRAAVEGTGGAFRAHQRRQRKEDGAEAGTGAARVVLPEGCAAGVWLHAVHRDETAWDQPDSFLPGRWLMTPDEWTRERASRRSFSADEAGGGGSGGAAAAAAAGAAAAAAAAAAADGDGAEDGDGCSAPPRLRVRFKGPAFMPFASGPRACVGQHLAWVFMRMVLARLVCRYTILPPPPPLARPGGGNVVADEDPLTPSVGFTVTPANAARVRLVPRRRR